MENGWDRRYLILAVQDEIHLIPKHDISPHREAYDCICQPQRQIVKEVETNERVWVHRTLSEILS